MTGPSPFNIKIKSLRLGDFTIEDVRELYAQHTAETGQIFTGDAVQEAYFLTEGQPWLVNAIAREITKEMKVPRGGVPRIANPIYKEVIPRVLTARAQSNSRFDDRTDAQPIPDRTELTEIESPHGRHVFLLRA